jgi:hypothetical protein
MTAPVESFTTPVMAPWSTWHNAVRPEKTQQKPNTNKRAPMMRRFACLN